MSAENEPPDRALQHADKLATASLALGLLSVGCTCLTGVPAVVLAALAYGKASPRGRKMAVAGAVSAIVINVGGAAILIATDDGSSVHSSSSIGDEVDEDLESTPSDPTGMSSVTPGLVRVTSGHFTCDKRNRRHDKDSYSCVIESGYWGGGECIDYLPSGTELAYYGRCDFASGTDSDHWDRYIVIASDGYVGYLSVECAEIIRASQPTDLVSGLRKKNSLTPVPEDCRDWREFAVEGS